MPKEVEHINDYLFKDTYKKNEIKSVMNENFIHDR